MKEALDIIRMGKNQLKDINTLQVRQKATDLLKIVGNKTTGDAPAAVLKYLKIEAQRLPTYAKLAAVDAVCQVSMTGDETTVDSLVSDDELHPSFACSAICAIRT